MDKDKLEAMSKMGAEASKAGELLRKAIQKKPRCYNCKFAGNQFKIGKLTHLHCSDPKEYTQDKFDNNEFCAWDTLRVFNETCDNHEFKK